MVRIFSFNYETLLSFFLQICDRINNQGWTVVQDPKRRMGPYAYKKDQWVSFDDKEMVQRKANYIRKLGIGGGTIVLLLI